MKKRQSCWTVEIFLLINFTTIIAYNRTIVNPDTIKPPFRSGYRICSPYFIRKISGVSSQTIRNIVPMLLWSNSNLAGLGETWAVVSREIKDTNIKYMIIRLINKIKALFLSYLYVKLIFRTTTQNLYHIIKWMIFFN